MNRVKRYILEKGYDICEPEIGWRMYSKKHPLDCGAVYAEGQHVDSEHAVQYEYVNTMGWDANIFMRDGSVRTINEDDAEWEQLKAGIKNDDIIFLRERPASMKRLKNGYAIMYGGFFGWAVDLLDCTRHEALCRFWAMLDAMPSLRLCVVKSDGSVVAKRDDRTFDEYQYSKYKYDKAKFANEIARVRKLLEERGE